MADHENERGHPAIPLPANGFELSDLDKAIDSAVKLKSDDKRQERIAGAIVECAADKATLARGDAIAVPEGHELKEIDVPELGTVKVPVAKVEPAKAEAARAQPTPTNKEGVADQAAS